MNQIPDSPVYEKNVFEFLTVANDFCLAMKEVEKTARLKLIDYIRKVGPLLYLKACLLPDVEVSNPDVNERFVTEEEWEALFNLLRNKFKKDDEFWFIDPYNPKEIVKGSLAEHMSDVYQDLQDFLLLYQKSSLAAKENAVSEISRLFKIRWGVSLINALNQFHYIANKNSMEPLESTEPSFF